MGQLLNAIGNAVGSALWSATKTAGKAVGSATLQVGKTTAQAVGAATYHTGKGAYKVAKGTANFTAAVAKDAWAARNETGPNNVIGRQIHNVGVMGRAMGNWERAKDVYNPVTGKLSHKSAHFNFSKKGKAALFGPALIAGGIGAAQTYEDNRVGQIDSNVVTATPDFTPPKQASYADNCGATGDLVFALHNNRFG